MPFTPYHFGVGLAAKAAAAPRFSWVAFCAAQVVIDCETLYYLSRHEHPVHRFFHSLLGAGMAGAAVSVALIGLLRALPWLEAPAGHNGWRSRVLRSELSPAGVWAGGLFGGLSHPLLDGMMHSDVRPFLPWSSSNPLLGMIDVEMLHQLCLLAGALGAVGLALWTRADKRVAR
ncbi:MAG TPA: metal-dependent hydrolase [Candidatus Eisenbacteria bacterium]|nr:metal-dependent hydrolase [Candidatus Eisenbacteria bacterium]